MFFLGLLISTVLYLCLTLAVGSYLGAVSVEAPIALGAIYLVLLLLSSIRGMVAVRKYPKYLRQSFGATLLTRFWADLRNPIRGLFAFVGAKRVIDGSRGRRVFSWSVVTLHFVWAVALIVTIAVVVASCL